MKLTAALPLAVFAALVVATPATAAEPVPPPEPPYDWDTPAQEFAPFHAIGPVASAEKVIVYAVTPAEGRALCEFEEKYYPPVLDCRVEPMSSQPDVTEPGWLNEWAAQNGFPVVD